MGTRIGLLVPDILWLAVLGILFPSLISAGEKGPGNTCYSDLACGPNMICTQQQVCECLGGFEPNKLQLDDDRMRLSRVCFISKDKACDPNLLKAAEFDLYFDPTALDAKIKELCDLGDGLFGTEHRTVDAAQLNLAKKFIAANPSKTPSDWSCFSGTCKNNICEGTNRNPFFNEKTAVFNPSICPPREPTTQPTQHNAQGSITSRLVLILSALAFEL